MKGVLLIRTDASVAIGTGHVMRCLALAQAWQDTGGCAVFAMAESTPSIQARLESELCETLSVSGAAGTQNDARQILSLARERQAEWVVVDGYQFNADYQSVLKTAGFKVLFLDDYGHARHYSADIVLNQNVCGNEAHYANRERQTRLLLGPRYCLLRREFAAWRDWNREVPPACRRLLVVMGGSDPANLTARVIEAVSLVRVNEVEPLEVTVVVGGSNPHFTLLQDAATRTRQKITVRKDVLNMPELMAAADVAVSAAGSTCWEFCHLGLPALLIDVAGNQTALAKDLDRRGCAVHVGDGAVVAEKIAHELERVIRSHDLRLSLSQRSRELVDGDGARRVVSVLRGSGSCNGEGLRLRPARADDAHLLWEWANDPEVRAASFSSDPIPWETHVAWMAEKLGQKGSFILIAEDREATPCGQIRLDLRLDGDWEVDISVSKTMRGHGLGSELIKLGVQALLTEHDNARVHAFVKLANTSSVKAFEQADFKLMGTEKIQDNQTVHLVYETTASE
jgi:UDP-2,4-diacetamido-2,4,6-trideoxy-beta-L-altropyranose hydrolase